MISGISREDCARYGHSKKHSKTLETRQGEQAQDAWDNAIPTETSRLVQASMMSMRRGKALLVYHRHIPHLSIKDQRGVMRIGVGGSS